MSSRAQPLVLCSPDDLTPEVLTAVLRGYDPGVTVTDVGLRRASQGTSSHVHLDVSYAEPETALPRHLFVKTQLGTVHDLPEAFDESLSAGGAAPSYSTMKPASTATCGGASMPKRRLFTLPTTSRGRRSF